MNQTSNQIGRAALKLLVCFSLTTATAALAATKIWVGTTDNFLLTAGNWSPSGTPQANASDIMQWDGSQAGNLLLTNNQSGSFNNLDNSPGLFVNVTAGQTGSLTVVESSGGTGRIRINSGGVFNVASGAGAVTFGNGSATEALGLVLAGSGNGATHAFTNNSANTVTFGSEVYYLMGGGGAHTMLLAGTGNFALNSRFQAQNSGSGLALTVGGSGTVSLGSAYAPGIGYGGSYNNVTLNNGTLKLTAADALGTGNTLVLNGGSLDSAVADLVNSGNNAQTWGGNFTFAGTENLNLGSGAVSMSASRIVTVSAKTLEVDGVIAGSGYSLTKSGAGTLLLGGANTYSGGTVVSNGVLKLGVSGAVPAGNVTIYSTLDLNGNSATITSLGGTGTVDTISGGAPNLTVNSGTFAGMIKNTTGSLTLTKNTSSILTLSGASTYSGGTAVNVGSLMVNGSIGSGVVTVASGAALGGTGTIGGSVDWQSGSTGSFSLTPTTGAGSNSTPLTVSGSVTLNDNAITVNVLGGVPLGVGTYKLMGYNNTGSSGAFNVGSPAYTGAGVASGTASTVATSGGQVILTVANTGLSTTWTNNGDGNWTTGANWNSNPAYPHNPGDAAFLGVGSAYTTVTLDGAVSLAALTFTNANSFGIADAGNALTFNNPYGSALITVNAGTSNAVSPAVSLATNLTISAVSGTSLALTNVISNASGSQTLTMNGQGTVVLSGVNTYGPAAGSVGTVLGGGGVLQLNNASAISSGDVSMPSGATIRAGAAMTLANNIVKSSGTTTLDDNGNNVTVSGVISGGGGLGKNGAGTLSLSSSNSYTGDTGINTGSVKLLNAAGIPGGAGRGNINMGAGTTLDLNGNSVVLGVINSTFSDAVVDSLTGGAVTLSLGTNGGFGTFAGSIKNTSGSLTLVKDGTGIQTLTGTNTYSGGTTILAGTLQIGNGGTTGTLGTGTLLNDGNLSFNLSGSSIFADQITGTGAVTLANSALVLHLNGNNTFTGPINITYGGGGALWITNASALGIGPKLVLCNSGNNSIHLDGSSGDINVDSSISFQVSDASGVLFNEGGSNTISGSVGMVNGNGDSYVKVNSGFLTLAGGIGTVSGNNNRTAILGGAGDGLISGDVTDGGPVCTLTKQDAGTWTLSGAANTYSGATTVSGGTLIIAGNCSGNGAVAVNGTSSLLLAGGNIYGSGAITVASGATLGGVGSIVGAATWQSGAKGAFTVTESGGMNTTPMISYGVVTLNNNALTVYVAGGTPLPAGTYDLLQSSSTISGSFATEATITGAGIAAGTKGIVSTSGTVVRLTVVNSSVWTFDGNGNWTTGANWDSNPNYPSSAGNLAVLGVGSSLVTINLNASETVGGISFTNANSFVITNQASMLTLDNNGGGATISVSGGSANAIVAGVSLTDATAVNMSTGTALSIPGDIGGGGTLSLTGNGTLSLSGSNAYNGLTISGGNLILGNTNAAGAGALTLNGGSLDSSVPNLVNANNNYQYWNGSFAFLGSQSLDLGSGSVTLGSGGATVTVSSNSLTVGGAMAGSSLLTKAGNGTLVLMADNSGLSGGVTITGGTVAAGTDTVFGSGTLNLSGPNLTIRSTDGTARTFANNVSPNAFDGPYIMDGTADLTFSGTIACGSFQKRFVISNSVTTFSGPFTGGTSQSQANIKDGPGRLILSADNSTLAKFIWVNQGTLALGSATAIGTGALTMNGGGLDSTVTDLVNSGNNPQTWAGNFYFAGSQNLNLGTGSVTMTANTTITISNNTLTIGGNISGSGRSLAKSGSGALVLSGANTYSNTTVTAGTLQIAQATLATNSAVAISDGAVLQLDFSTTNQVAALVLGGTNQTAGVYKAAGSGGHITGTGALLVVPLTAPVNPNPPVVQVSVSANTLTLAWPTNLGWTLQTNSVGLAAASQWFDYPGSAAMTNVTIPVNPALTNVFFRMVYTNTP